MRTKDEYNWAKLTPYLAWGYYTAALRGEAPVAVSVASVAGWLMETSLGAELWDSKYVSRSDGSKRYERRIHGVARRVLRWLERVGAVQ